MAAAQEERWTRQKHDHRFPAQAIHYCLGEEGLTVRDLDLVAFYELPFLKFERLLETYLAFAPRGLRSFLHAMPPDHRRGRGVGYHFLGRGTRPDD